MFIKVTNAKEERNGDAMLININSIVSVYENLQGDGKYKTIIYASDTLGWMVEESLTKVHSLIKAASK